MRSTVYQREDLACEWKKIRQIRTSRAVAVKYCAGSAEGRRVPLLPQEGAADCVDNEPGKYSIQRHAFK
jgi:hypothetical protein